MSQDIHENEDSVINEEAEDTAESTKEETEEKSEEETKEETNEDKEDNKDEESEKDDESKKDYRPKSEQPKDETVPLKKYLELKKDLKALQKERESDGEDLSTEDLDSLADEYKLEPTALKKLAKTISTMTLKEAQKLIAPLKAEKMEAENTKAFEADFEKTIISKYPELANKKEQFKKIAFSPDFVHLNNLEAIRKEFFADITTKTKESIEGGSKGVSKGTESIDFANMTPEQHARALKDPETRKALYKWQDEQGS